MEKRPHLIYEFGPFRLDMEQRILAKGGDLVPLAPKVLETLMLLVQNRGRIMEKDELVHALWPESFVEESNLSQNIFLLRKLLGDDRNARAYIQTIPRRGYRFVAEVNEADAAMPPIAIPAADYWKRHSPFRSLQVFEPEDAWLFFGRDAESKDLLARLDASSVLVMVGNSGCGKSSLLRAGLIPALRAGRFSHQGTAVDSWRIAMFRPSAAPFDYLAEVLPRQLAPQLSLKDEAEFIAECRNKLRTGEDALRNAIIALVNGTADKSGETHVLLVADQFEELFTLTPDSEVRDRYIDALLAAARLDSALPVHVVLALRADFYAHCLDHPELSRLLESNLYNVPRMTQDQLRESIEKRLELAAAPAEAGLINVLLEDVGAEPGNLALLEHALGQLWERCGGSGRTLTNRAYAEIGRLRGALGRHADAVFESMYDEREKRLAKRIFLELVHLGEGAQDTRRRVSKSDLHALGTAETVEPLLVRLTSSRLISAGLEGDTTFVEVSHEALIREWPALREWLLENREELAFERRLHQAAAEWEALAKDKGALLQGSRLARGEEWLARHPHASPLLQQFLKESVAECAAAQERELAQQRELRSQAEARAQAERELREQQASSAVESRRSAFRLRWLSYALGILMLVAVAAAGVAYRQQRIEKSDALSAQSGELLARDHGQALSAAMQSWRIAKTEEARLAVAKAFPELLATLKHEGPVMHVTFSPDGRQILSASADHTARLWSATDGRLLAVLQGHTDEVEDAEFSPDGQHVVTAGLDHAAKIWDARDGRLLATLSGHTDKLEQASYSPDANRIVTASWDHTARLWSSRDGRLLAVLAGHTDKLLGAVFSPDGRHILTASEDHTARVWSSLDGHLETTLQGHTDWVYQARFLPDGDRIVTASLDRTARIWSRDGRLLATLRHDGAVNSAQPSRDGQRIVTVSDDHTARVWNTADGHMQLTLPHGATVHDAEFSRDGRYIVTASWDRTGRVWDSSNGRLLAVLGGSGDIVNQAVFSPDGRRIVTAGADPVVRAWNTNGSLMLTSLAGHSGAVAHAEFSPSGQRILTVGKDETARLWRSDGVSVAILKGNAGGFRQAHFSLDGQRLVTSGMDGVARVWSSDTGRLLVTLKGHSDKVEQAEYSPDGSSIVTASWDHTGRVWDGADGRLLAVLEGHTKTLWYAAFSSDSRRIVTASDDQTARVYEADGRPVAVLQGHSGPVWRAVFSPDGRRIVTASFDHTARVWDSSDGRLLAILAGHSDLVDAAEFSPDGKLIVTASWDNTARVWNSYDGRLLAILQGHTNKLIGAAFSPDGRYIVTASQDRMARVWSASDFGLVAILGGHSDQIWQAAFSADSQFIVTASLDQTARIWRVLTLDDIKRVLAQ